MRILDIRMTMWGIAVASLLSACATMGPSPEEEITAMLDQYHVEQAAGNVDEMMVHVSENFTNSQGATKTVMRGFFNAAASQGFFTNLKVNMDGSELVMEGDTAKIGPIGYETPLGGITVTYTVEKEPDGVWRIVNADQR